MMPGFGMSTERLSFFFVNSLIRNIKSWLKIEKKYISCPAEVSDSVYLERMMAIQVTNTVSGS